jgi:hypothetical protein
MKALTLILAVGLLLASTSPAFAQSEHKVWIFITEPSCVPDDALALSEQLSANASPYNAFIFKEKFEVVCFSTAQVKDIPADVNNLRVWFSNDKFLFLYHLAPKIIKDEQHVPMVVYDDNNHIYFQLYLASLDIYPSDVIPKVYGKTLVEQGYGYADYRMDVLKHEWAHLTTCSEHLDGSDRNNPATWTHIAEVVPFCS